MKGWMLYFRNSNELRQTDYECHRFLEAAEAKGIDLEIFRPEQFEIVINGDRKNILIDDEYREVPDFLLPRLGSETTYFALAVIRHLENLGVYCCNSSRSIDLVRDKLHVHQILAQSDIPTPKTMLLKFPVNPKTVRKEIGFPVVIKSISGTEGKGIYLCQTEEQFVDLMDFLYDNNQRANIILQEYISSSEGKDLRIFVIGGKPVGAMQRVAEKGFKSNFSLGGKVYPFPLTNELEWLSSEVVRLLHLDTGGIDILFEKENQYKVCEANSAPGFRGLEKVVGNIIPEHIFDFISLHTNG